MIRISRRNFLGGAAAWLGCGGDCLARASAGGTPRLKVGIVSDPHVTTPESTAVFRKTLAFFRDRQVDAVLVAGDLSDWGLKSGLQAVADAWFDVFPNNRAPDGRPVEKLFCTGNHDYEGWRYGDMTLDMHVHGYSEDEALTKLGIKKCWEAAFHEEWLPIRRRAVNGYDFISAEWERADLAIADRWLEENGKTLDPEKPFFFFSHIPLAGTTSSSPPVDSRQTVKNLARHPNAVSLSGHTHWTLNDERSIWQGAFTALSIPSISYTGLPGGYENGCHSRGGDARAAMRGLPARENLERAQGFVLSVFDDRMVFERRDLKEGVEAAPPWVVPLPVRDRKPYALSGRGRQAPVPQFPAGAALETRTANLDTRNGHWAIMMMLEFPAARAEGGRVFDYEVRAEREDGSAALVKRYLSPGFYKLEREEPARLRFALNAVDLPERGRYRLCVYPRNCFGARGRPIASAFRESVPGKTRAKA